MEFTMACLFCHSWQQLHISQQLHPSCGFKPKTDCLCQQSATHVSAAEFSAELPYISQGRMGMLRLSLMMSMVYLRPCPVWA